jgi:hypothetical protein
VADGGGIGQAHQFQQFQHPPFPGFAWVGVMHAHDFRDLLADGQQGIQRGQRLLENHGHFASAHAAQDVFVLRQQIAAAQQDLPGFRAEIVGKQTHNGIGAHGFPGAGFSDDAQDFSCVDVVGNVPDGVGAVASRGQGDAQVPDGEQGRIGRRQSVLGHGIRLHACEVAD